MTILGTFIQESVRYFRCNDDNFNFHCFKNEDGEWLISGGLENELLADIDDNGRIKNALDSFVRKEKLGKLLGEK